MENFKICTDSGCDIKNNILKLWDVTSLSLTFRFTDSDTEYKNDEMDINDFYTKMTEGKIAKTSAVNSESFASHFEAIIKEGFDILYIGFSSGLSTTYNCARIAAEELMKKYPERKIIAVDSLCASAGQGLLLRLALDRQAEGKSIHEVAEYVEDTKLKICHWFTVNDLVYLKRGGRVSPAVAFVGNMLGIKPVLHVDNAGHLVNVGKVRGRRSAIAALASKYDELKEDGVAAPVYISHAYCENDARELAKIIQDKHGVKTEIITDVGPVIGAHSGPGTLAVFFVGKER